MVRTVFLTLGLIVLAMDAGRGQDIAGIEDCTKTAGLDKRTGCLQSNVNFLQRLMTNNALEAAQQAKAMQAEIVALKAGMTSLRAAVEELSAAQKTRGDKKPEAQ